MTLSVKASGEGTMIGDRSETAGYDERLRLACMRGPRPMSGRALARRVREAQPEVDGTTDSGVRQYLKGLIGKPRIEILRAFAEVLGVRADWLAFNVGEMTEFDEAFVQMQEHAASALEDGDAVVRIIQARSGSGSEQIASRPVIQMAVLGTYRRLFESGFDPQVNRGELQSILELLGLDIEGLEKDLFLYTWGPEPLRRIAIAIYIGDVLGAPFARLQTQLRPSDLSDRAFADYVTSIGQGLHRLADAYRDRPSEIQLLPEPTLPEPGPILTTDQDAEER